ncbi:hypothetical protein ES702_05438 [subsurface metagenome]
MTSEKQLKANRQNAKLGGVKTEEGKAISKYNALKHGLLSEKVLIGKESKRELEELDKKVREDLKPRSEIEMLLVDRMVANFWRLRRAMTKEEESVFSDYKGMENDADIFFRYETMLERGIYKALHELQRIQSARAGEKPPIPLAVDVDVSGVNQ